MGTAAIAEFVAIDALNLTPKKVAAPEEIRREARRRPLVKLAWGAALHELAVAQDRDLV